MIGIQVGYALRSSNEQDLTAQRRVLLELGIALDRVFLDYDLTETTRTTRARTGLDQALTSVCAGDAPIVPKLDCLTRSVPETNEIGDDLAARSVALSLCANVCDRTASMGKMPFKILATFANSRSTCCGCAFASAWPQRRLRASGAAVPPRLNLRQQRELRHTHAIGTCVKSTFYRPVERTETALTS